MSPETASAAYHQPEDYHKIARECGAKAIGPGAEIECAKAVLQREVDNTPQDELGAAKYAGRVSVCTAYGDGKICPNTAFVGDDGTVSATPSPPNSRQWSKWSRRFI